MLQIHIHGLPRAVGEFVLIVGHGGDFADPVEMHAGTDFGDFPTGMRSMKTDVEMGFRFRDFHQQAAELTALQVMVN